MFYQDPRLQGPPGGGGFQPQQPVPQPPMPQGGIPQLPPHILDWIRMQNPGMYGAPQGPPMQGPTPQQPPLQNIQSPRGIQGPGAPPQPPPQRQGADPNAPWNRPPGGREPMGPPMDRGAGAPTGPPSQPPQGPPQAAEPGFQGPPGGNVNPIVARLRAIQARRGRR